MSSVAAIIFVLSDPLTQYTAAAPVSPQRTETECIELARVFRGVRRYNPLALQGGGEEVRILEIHLQFGGDSPK